MSSSLVKELGLCGQVDKIHPKMMDKVSTRAMEFIPSY